MFTSSKGGLTPLHIAVENGNEKILERLLKSGVLPNIFTKNGLSPMHIAVRKEDKKLVLLLLKYGADVDASGKNSIETPLSVTAQIGNTEIFRILSESSSRRFTNWREGYISLCVAAYYGHETIVKILLEKGVDPNTNLENYLTPLHAAAQNGHHQIVELLLQYNAEVNPTILSTSKSFNFSSPLLASLYGGKERTILLLLNRGANVNLKLGTLSQKCSSSLERLLTYGSYSDFEVSKDGKAGYTPLHFAVELQNENIVKLLLDRGAEVNVKSHKGVTPIIIAVEENQEAIVRYLLSAGADVNLKSIKNTTALDIAVEKGLESIVQELLQAGADVNTYHRPLLLTAVAMKNEKIAEMLINYKVDVNVNFAQQTPLGIAVQNELVTTVENLLEAGADPNVKLNNYEPVLITAIVKKNAEIIKLLLKYKVWINFSCIWNPFSCYPKYTDKDYTPLSIAVLKSTSEIVEMLLENGAVVNVETRDFPLHLAVKRGQRKMVRNLIKYGASVNSVCKKKKTPLVHAVEKNFAGVVRILINKGASVEMKTDKGESLLHLALDKGENINIIKMLLASGIDVDARNREGSVIYRVLGSENGSFNCRSTYEESDDYEDIEEEEEDSEIENQSQDENLEKGPIDIILLKLLLAYDAKLNDFQYEYEESLLHLAIRQGKIKAVELLLQNGVDINFLNGLRKTPLEVAIDKVPFDLDKMEVFKNVFFFASSIHFRFTRITCLIIQEIARLEALNEKISEKNLELIKSTKIKLFYENCQKEIEDMRKREISNKLSYFDILIGDRNKLAVWFRNRNVNKVLKTEEYLNHFPLYGEFLKARIKEGKTRKVLVESSLESLKNIFRFEFPSLVVQEIFSYLSSRDLRNMCIACKPAFFLDYFNS